MLKNFNSKIWNHLHYNVKKCNKQGERETLLGLKIYLSKLDHSKLEVDIAYLEFFNTVCASFVPHL